MSGIGRLSAASTAWSNGAVPAFHIRCGKPHGGPMRKSRSGELVPAEDRLADPAETMSQGLALNRPIRRELATMIIIMAMIGTATMTLRTALHTNM
jgi:hypothetical protein